MGPLKNAQEDQAAAAAAAGAAGSAAAAAGLGHADTRVWARRDGARAARLAIIRELELEHGEHWFGPIHGRGD